ncbi:MAG: hypothetical protein GX455_01830 [Phycisphaerae bacterium]|nr:hypothetical protein [Phycisphaerae bacterium]
MSRRRSKLFGSVTLWAWIVSLALHGLIFAVLSGYRPSFALADARLAASAAADLTQTRLRRLPPQPVTRKPQVRKLVSIHQQPSVRPVPIEMPAPISIPMDHGAGPMLPSSSAPADAGFFTEATEFFGQLSADRKICYVVDASGSMLGRFDPVRTQLQQSLSALAPDQYFYIIFFQDGDKLIESANGRFVRASPLSIQTAYDFIATIRPKGATNAVEGLRRGMSIRDKDGQGPGLIYFLTDGFDLEQTGVEGFARRIENLRKTLAPRTKINTIGFRTEQTDLQILRDIAAASGGQFSSVE